MSNSLMIRAIVYDAVGTLMHVQPSVEAVYAEVGERFGSRLDADQIRRRFRAAFAEQDRLDQEAGWRTSEARERERWRGVVAQIFDDIADHAGCFETLFAAFAKPRVWTFDPEWERVSAVFHERGYRQAIASNFDRRLRALVHTVPHAVPLEHLVISSEIGWRKPAPEFFAHLIATLQLPPEAILFVGDDPVNDYDPALRAGLRALLFDPRRQHPDVGADRIERLGELLEHVPH